MVTTSTTGFSLEDYLANPPDCVEWVNGQLVEKEVTVKHSQIQARLVYFWKNYIINSGQGGDVYTELPCRTVRQGRRPDVAYLTAELAAQFDTATALPQSPSLVAEIVSPTDAAEELFVKAQEYLESGCQEVWLVFPESQRILILTQGQTFGFHLGDVVSTQLVLQGFSLAVNELLV